MYKLIAYYRAVTPYLYPAVASIYQFAPSEYVLYIFHEQRERVKCVRGALPDIEKVLFAFNPRGYGFPPISWKKVQINGN